MVIINPHSLGDVLQGDASYSSTTTYAHLPETNSKKKHPENQWPDDDHFYYGSLLFFKGCWLFVAGSVLIFYNL